MNGVEPRGTARDGEPRVGRLVLWRVFWRSLFLQAAWNPKGMQNVGFAFALYPALEKLYPDPSRLAEAAERHLCCFNCHPYSAAAILGGALYHEERVAAGHEPPETVNAFKHALMGPFAALGDGFFWLSLRPAVGALAALAVLLAAGPWAALGYFLGYNLVHLALRARFLVAGYQLGDKVVEAVAASRLPFFGERLRVLAALAAGAVAGVAAVSMPLARELGHMTVLGATGLFIVCHTLVGRGLSPYLLAYGAAALALGVGLIC